MEYAQDVLKILVSLKKKYKLDIVKHRKDTLNKKDVKNMMKQAVDHSEDHSIRLREIYALIKSEFQDATPGNNNENLIEEFFVIGEDVSAVDLMDVDEKDSYHNPKTFYQFRQRDVDAECAKRHAAKIFCFPSGVKMSRLKETDVARMTSGGQTYFTKDQSFVFTIQNQNDKQFDMEKDQFIYCLCVTRDEVLSQDDGKKLNYFMTQRAYCVMSVFKYYDFHLQLINNALNIEKVEHSKMANKEKDKNPKHKDYQADAIAKINGPIVSKALE